MIVKIDEGQRPYKTEAQKRVAKRQKDEIEKIDKGQRPYKTEAQKRGAKRQKDETDTNARKTKGHTSQKH